MDFVRWFISEVERPMLMWGRGWRGRLEYERFFKERLAHSVEENAALQRQRLFNLVSDAIQHVPYYRDIARREGILPSVETIESDLKRFPILTKDIIRRECESLKRDRLGEGVYENTSGGSTGVPVKFLQDKQFRLQDPGLILDGFSGYRLGDRMVQLWGSERDILQGGIGLKNKALNRFLYRKRVFNSFRMTNADMFGFVEQINAFKPVIMIAYVQSAYELACFIEREELRVFKMDGIITSAGTLYDDFRKKIETVFGCPVFDRYGSREVTCIAMECEAHEGLHLNLLGQYMEILDDENFPVPPQTMGRVIITSLTNYSMPLLRFEIGDLAVPSERRCSCGRGLPLIERVKGRTVNVFKTKNGALVDGEYFTHLFYERGYIQQFQVIQQELDKVVVRYVPTASAKAEALEAMQDDMRGKIAVVMGGECRVEFDRTDEILPTASGKFVYTVSNV